MSLGTFIYESNVIEGITREPTETELQAYKTFLAHPEIHVHHLNAFVWDVAGALLRWRQGRDVRVGPHRPPRGGPEIESALEAICADVSSNPAPPPYDIHRRYETLHPYMDGNGRSGRVLWAWQMQRRGQNPFGLPFLQRWYYDSLQATR